MMITGDRTFIRLEVTAVRFSSYAILIAIIADKLLRVIEEGIPQTFLLLWFQAVLWLLHFGFTEWRIKADEDKNVQGWAPYLDVFFQVMLFVTLSHIGPFYIPLLIPIAVMSLTRSFKKCVPMLAFSFVFQSILQSLIFSFDIPLVKMRHDGSLLLFLMNLILQYVLFFMFCAVLGLACDHFKLSKEDNARLVDRLSEKYVQLEEARRDIEANYELLSTASQQKEETNKKLNSSLAEFFTIQQISQAISSMLDINELLKFVNDVIIGVMGVSNSSIALLNNQTDKMRVFVSSISDKRELAVFTDYINHDIGKGSITISSTLLDNSVSSKEYIFTEGRNVKSILCVPLAAKGCVLGMVIVEQLIEEAFTKENARLLEIIAQQTSIAIDNARLYQQMQELASIDGLTGAYNRIYFQKFLRQEYDTARQKGTDLALVMMDIDRFKRFNDTHGHQFGDLVLKVLASWIREHIRKTDIFARYGGEEFVILMPYTAANQAFDKAEELRQGISQITVSDRVITTSITVSMGVSGFPEIAKSENDLIKTADNALYEAKNGGRNLVRMGSETVSPPPDGKENSHALKQFSSPSQSASDAAAGEPLN